MKKLRKNNLFVIAVLVILFTLFAASCNASVKNLIKDLSAENRQFLSIKNELIASVLQSADSIDRWDALLNEFEDLEIAVENSKKEVVARTETKYLLSESISQTMDFEYKGKRYTIVSSVHFLNNFSEHMESLIDFIIMEFVIGIAAIIATLAGMYAFVIRPYKVFYDSIEEYEKTGKIVKRSFKGYVGEVYNRFFALTKNLRETEEKERRIIASISHDIKTPLTSIMGYTERLSKDNISEERKERYLETIYSRATEIRQLVDEFDEFLDYRNSGQTEKENISLSEIFESLKREYEEELSSYGVKAEFVSEENGEAIFADKKKLARVFGNIVGNSVKHFEKEENKIIRFTVSSDKKEAVIAIADNGRGVSEENLEVIFEPFYTSDKGRKVAGLGLSICREIIENHGGQIYARTSDMGGLEIVIRLSVY